MTLSVPLPDDFLELLADEVARRLPECGREYLTAKEAAEYLRTTPSRLHKLSSSGRLRPRKEGARLLYVRSELDEWLDSGEAELA